MKKLVAILLLCSVLIQISGKLLIWVNFEIHQDYIAKNLCVNRDKPYLHCDGKCQLVKRLNEDNKKENSPANTLKNQTEQVLFCEYFCHQLVPVVFQVEGLGQTYFEKPYDTTRYSVFHPPRG